MTAATVMSELKKRGITLQAHGNSLRYRPRSAVGPELLERLRDHKAGIIRMLNERGGAAEARQVFLRPEGTLPDELLDELSNWPDLPSKSELRSRGRNFLRNHAVARSRIELNDAADAWDRMCEKFKNRKK
jgi:hypothetical protein